MRELSLEMAMSRRAPMAGSPDARLWPARIDCPWMRFGTFLRLDETSIGSVPSTVRKWALGSQWARFHAADTHRQVPVRGLDQDSSPSPRAPHVLARGGVEVPRAKRGGCPRRANIRFMVPQ